MVTSTNATSSFYNQVWYPDFGANHHVTPDAANLMNVVDLSSSYQIHIGIVHGLSIKSLGSMFFSSPYYPNTSLKLNKLLLVLAITKNLVSVSQFVKDNSIFDEFHANACYIYVDILLGSR